MTQIIDTILFVVVLNRVLRVRPRVVVLYTVALSPAVFALVVVLLLDLYLLAKMAQGHA